MFHSEELKSLKNVLVEFQTVLVEFQIVLVEIPILNIILTLMGISICPSRDHQLRVSTRLNPVEIPIAICPSRNSSWSFY